MTRAVPLLVLVVAAVPALAGQSGKDVSGAMSADAVAAQVNSAIQGALLLAQALPHDDGPKPTKAMQDKMDKAAPLVYNAYNIMKNAEDNAEAAVEQMKTGIQTAGSASGIATAEALLQRGQAKLREGAELAQAANADFMNNADPLGPPPQPPRAWGNVDNMSARARQKASSVQRLVSQAKSLAREKGISLITVSSEKVMKIGGEEDYATKAENKILDFLSSYA